MNDEIINRIIRNQMLILLILKRLLPAEAGFDSDGLSVYAQDPYLVDIIDKCLKQSEEFTMLDDERDSNEEA